MLSTSRPICRWTSSRRWLARFTSPPTSTNCRWASDADCTRDAPALPAPPQSRQRQHLRYCFRLLHPLSPADSQARMLFSCFRHDFPWYASRGGQFSVSSDGGNLVT